MIPNLCLIILVFCYYRVSGAQKINVFSDHHSQGIKAEVSISECSNFAENMAGEVTSIDTRGNCARFYDAKDCSGNSIEVMPRSPSHNNLHFWNFNDKARSVGPCPHMCDTSVTGAAPEADEGVNLEIYSRKKFKGAYAELKVKGCTLIPTRFTFQLLSVKVFGKCLQFYNNVGCQHSGQKVDSIELRRGTPLHDDISTWVFSEVRAVSHCSYKCNNTGKSLDSKPSQSGFSLKPNEAILFDAKEYAGNFLRLTVVSCVDIQNEWEGAAVSTKTFNGTCVTLFEKRGCAGDSLNVNGENSDLSSRNFDALTRSIRPCTRILMSHEGSKNGSNGKGGSASAQAPPSVSPFIIVIIITLPLFGVLLSIFLVLLIMRKCNPYKTIVDKLSEKEIDEFLSGLGMDLGNNVGGGGVEIDGDYSAELLAQNRPYNDAYEILRSNITFDPKLPLGMGEFGVVYKGSVQVLSVSDTGCSSKVKRVQVAVKTVKPGATVQCLRSLLKEVKVMLYVGKHDHIVQMIGCCTENLRKGEILILMENCLRGSLEGFLEKNRDKFKNFVKKGRLDWDKMNNEGVRDSTLNETDYQNIKDGTLQSFDVFQLLRWCIDIANGMEFLTSKKVIHSDLAARNVLLDESFLAKISDFGLSRQLYCYTQYVKKKQEPLPWRWLAIESLTNFQFSSQSDVWSFGVLCWEIFTLGEKPYPGVVWNDDFLRNLKDGLRLGKPKFTVSDCYNLMLKCWEEEPNNRPSFSEIYGEFQDIFASLQPSQNNQNYFHFQIDKEVTFQP